MRIPFSTDLAAAFALGSVLLLFSPAAAAAQSKPASKDFFPLTRDRFGTLGAPASKEHWDVLGARWFKSGDCYWQGGD